jgi:hypothetical protein
MISPRMRILGCVGAVLCGALLVASAAPAAAADKKGPPACAAIKFRPLASGMQDGEQDAGLYKSRFGRIELRASVKQGEPQDYYVVSNGQKAGAANSLPKSAETCAHEKKMPAPSAKGGDASCTGQRFNVVIDRQGQQKVAMLYALDGGHWKFCRASSL